MSKNASWAHKPILIKTNITTILQLSPNNSIVDYTFIQTYIKIYNSNTCYLKKKKKTIKATNQLLQNQPLNELSSRGPPVPEKMFPRQGELSLSSGITLNGLLST